MKLLTVVAFTLLIVGGLNWGFVGLFQTDLIGILFGSNVDIYARIIYILVGLSAMFCLPLYKYVCETDAARRAAMPDRTSV